MSVPSLFVSLATLASQLPVKLALANSQRTRNSLFHLLKTLPDNSFLLWREKGTRRRSIFALLTLCRSKSLTDFRWEGGNPGCTPKSSKQLKQRLSNNEKRRPLPRKTLNSCETARRRSKTGAERGRLLQNCMRETPVSALLLPLNVSVVPDWNKFRQPLSLHTELQHSRGVASSTKSLKHAAGGCCCFSLLL